MAVNKVVFNTADGEQTLIDLTGDSVTPDTLAEGVTAHDASGAQIVGTMQAGEGGGGGSDSQLMVGTYARIEEYGMRYFAFTFEPGTTWEDYETSMYNTSFMGAMFYVQEDGYVYNDSLGESIVSELDTGERAKGKDEIKPTLYVNDSYFNG